MKTVSVFLIAIACLIFSCNSQQQESENSKVPVQEKVADCYQYINNNDTIILKTINVNGFITGTLVYNLYEKDKNRGTIQGAIKRGLLIADYTFVSEGTKSVRQVAFKKDGENFIEGYGDAADKGGKMIFKNIDSLTFNSRAILKPYDCEK